MPKSINIQETNGGSVTVGLPEIRRGLIAKGIKHRGNRPVTTRIFDTVEGIQALAGVTTPEQREALGRIISANMAEAARLMASTVTKGG